jgi:cytidine deaminase
MYIGVLGCGPRPYKGGYDDLLMAANEALKNAHAPYSKFSVGSAIMSGSGKIYSGANVENASSGAGICAERAALASAISAGEREIKAIAIVADTSVPITPCGICRQSLVEFGEDIVVIMAGKNQNAIIASIEDLLPVAFLSRRTRN